MHLMSALQQRLIFGSLDLINYSKLPAVIRNQSRDGISVGSSFIEPFSNDCRKPKPKRNQSNRALNFDSHSRKRLYVTKLYQHEQRGSVAKEWNFPPVILSFRSEFAVFRPKKPSLSRSPSEKHEWPIRTDTRIDHVTTRRVSVDRWPYLQWCSPRPRTICGYTFRYCRLRPFPLHGHLLS